MAYQIDRILVVGVSSTALFDLTEEERIFKDGGISEYRKYQIENSDKILAKGVAFPFIKRYLNINQVYSGEIPPVEVVLVSKNSPETGIRIFKSIQYYDLNISRAVFTSGESPYKYIPAYNISLFLSTNEEDVINAIRAGYPAGRILKTKISDCDDSANQELRLAFDFDGVIADDESEKVYSNSGGQLPIFHNYEKTHVHEPHTPGPLAVFFKKISYFQAKETKKQDNDPSYRKILRTAIVTARNAPAHERAINTLKSWGVGVDDMFLLGGIAKSGILKIYKPHLYMDDQMSHLDPKLVDIPLVHIPFGVSNI